MARLGLILVGDSTSHGGVVLEGADTDTLNGRAIACVGHRVSCPKCKGDFPILPNGSGGNELPWIGGLNGAMSVLRSDAGCLTTPALSSCAWPIRAQTGGRPGRSASQRFADYVCVVRWRAKSRAASQE